MRHATPGPMPGLDKNDINKTLRSTHWLGDFHSIKHDLALAAARLVSCRPTPDATRRVKRKGRDELQATGRSHEGGVRTGR